MAVNSSYTAINSYRVTKANYKTDDNLIQL